jgi:hypothetical protein
MNSLGVFYDVNLKKSNDIMDVFDEALSKTNNLMETMDNFNTHKRIEKNTNNELNKNDINDFNIIRNNNRLRTYNPKKTNKSQLKPIVNKQYNFRKREPYNYQKEYENELINQIEKLFNPSYQNNGKKEEIGMLSFLSPLINSNIDQKNKIFYGSKKNTSRSKISELNNINRKKNENENELLSNKMQNILGNDNQKLKISKNNSYLRKENKSIERKINKDKFQKNKYNIPEINELKKNRYFSRTKTNFRSNIVARDINSNSKKNESNIDQLIKKLKKHYS